MKNILILVLLGMSATASRAADTNAVQLTPAFVSVLAEELRTNHSALRAVESGVRAARFNTNVLLEAQLIFARAISEQHQLLSDLVFCAASANSLP